MTESGPQTGLSSNDGDTIGPPAVMGGTAGTGMPSENSGLPGSGGGEYFNGPESSAPQAGAVPQKFRRNDHVALDPGGAFVDVPPVGTLTTDLANPYPANS